MRHHPAARRLVRRLAVVPAVPGGAVLGKLQLGRLEYQLEVGARDVLYAGPPCAERERKSSLSRSRGVTERANVAAVVPSSAAATRSLNAILFDRPRRGT